MTRSLLHLMLSHIPMIGTVFNLAVFMLGYVRHNAEMQLFAFGAFMVLLAITILAFLSGFRARDVIMRSPAAAASVSESHIAKHILYSKFLLFTMTALGGTSFAGMIILLQGYLVPENLFFSMTGIGLLNLVLMVYVLNSGYKIRHPEVARSMIKRMQGASNLPPLFMDQLEEDRENTLEHRLREDQTRLMNLVSTYRPAGRRTR